MPPSIALSADSEATAEERATAKEQAAKLADLLVNLDKQLGEAKVSARKKAVETPLPPAITTPGDAPATPADEAAAA